MFDLIRNTTLIEAYNNSIVMNTFPSQTDYDFGIDKTTHLMSVAMQQSRVNIPVSLS